MQCAGRARTGRRNAPRWAAAGLLALGLHSASGVPLLAQDAAPDTGALVRDGARHHDAFDLEAARDSYETALRLDPTSDEAKLGVVHLLNDLAADALAAADDAREDHNDDDDAHALTARAVSSLDRARDLARELQAAWPTRPEGYYWYAVSVAGLTRTASGPEKVRNSREIDAAARRAIALDPCFAAAWAVLGVAQREVAGVGWLVRSVARATLGGLPSASLEEAEGLLRGASALDPTDPLPLYELGITLEVRGRSDEAADAYKRALCLSDREPRDRRNRADAADRLRRLSERR